MLLITDAALTIVRNGLSLEDAAMRYGVSKHMVQFRANMTGARRRVQTAGYARESMRRPAAFSRPRPDASSGRKTS